MPSLGEELPREHTAGPADLCFVRLARKETESSALSLVTGGANAEVCIRPWDAVGDAERISRLTEPGQPVLALASDSAQRTFAAAFDDNAVRLFSPSGDLRCVVSQTQLPARTLGFSPSGEFLAIAGDDEGVRVMQIRPRQEATEEATEASTGPADASLFAHLPTQPFTASIAYDPEGEFLAVGGQDGSLSVWDIATKRQVWVKKHAMPKSSVADGHLCKLAWHPDGGCQLLVPGFDADVQVFERLSWTPLPSIPAPSLSGPLSAVSPSPNGLYIAASDRNGKVSIVEVPTKEEVASAAGDDALWGAAWDPIGNALATIDAQGVPRAWRLPVPEGKTLPGDMSVLEADSPPVAIDAEAEEAGDGGAEEEDGDESSEDSMADFIDDAAGLFKGEGLKAKKRKKKGRSVKAGRQGMAWGRPQGPVQAGETPGKGDGKRRFLAYSLTGYVACLDNGDHQTLTATLHDSLARARPISHNDYNGICMAALCPDGMAWASRKEAPPGAQPAPAAFDGVGFISFDSWAKGRSEWSLPLAQGETPACVAAGGGFLAVATAQRTLRVISHGGVQIGVFSLDGDPVALCAAGDLLAVLFHSAFVARDGDQKLAFQVWNVATRAALYQGPVALSPRAAVTWVGFSEDEFLAVYDSEGVMRVRSHEMGGQWVPVFAAKKHQKSDQEDFFIVGLNTDEVFCIVTRKGEHPQPHPRPIQQRFPTQVPVLRSVGWELEEQALRRRILLAPIRVMAEEGNAQAMETLQEEEKTIDALTLKQMNEALHQEDFLKAYDLAANMITLPMLEGALRLAGPVRNAALTERIGALVEERTQAELLAQEQEAAAMGMHFDLHTDAAPDAAQEHPTTAGEAEHYGEEGAGEEGEEPGASGDQSTHPLQERDVGQVGLKTTNPFSRKSNKGKRVAEAPPEDQRTKANPFARRKASKV